MLTYGEVLGVLEEALPGCAFLELLIPDRFLVPVPRLAERHPKHPGPSPFARRGVERRRATEKNRLVLRRQVRSERHRRLAASSAPASPQTVSPIRSSRRTRSPRP